MDESVAQKDEKLVADKLLELVYRRFSLTFWSTLLVSGGVVAALWTKVKPEILLAWMLSLWLVAGARQFYARRYLDTGRDNVAGQEKWLAGMVLGAVAGGACWGSSVYLFPAHPNDVITMLLLFVIAGVAGFACVTMAAVPAAAMVFMSFALVQPAFWLFSFGAREYYFMGGVALVYLVLMMVYVRQMYRVIRSSLTTTEQNKELSAALAEVKSLKYAAAQKESEQRYRELFANFEDSIVFIDVAADGKFLVDSINPAAERTLSVRDAEMRGKSTFDLFPAALAARLVEHDRFCVQSGLPQNFEEMLELPSGNRYFSVTQIPMHDESGRVYRIAAIARDITERKQMEETLAVREREFRTLAENSPDPIFRYDRECRRIFANSMVARTSGIPLEKLLGQTPTGSALVPSPESIKVQQSVQRVLDSGVADEVEVLFVAPDGSEMYFQNIHVPEFVADGSVQSVLSMGRDVTARKYMESVLLKSASEYRMLAENSPDNIVRFDREFRVRYLNKNLESAAGMPAGYLLGKNLAEVFTDGIFDELEVTLKKVAENGQGCDHYQAMPDTGKGERFHHLRIAPERDEHGTVSGILVIGRDITERKRQEEELRKNSSFQQSLLKGISEVGIQMMVFESGRVVYAHDLGFAARLGYSAEQIAAQPPFINLVHPDDRARVADTHRRRMAGEEVPEVYEIGLIMADGSRCEFELAMTIISDTNPAQLIAIGRDITERKRVEQSLEKTGWLLSSVLQGIPDPVWMKDADGKFVVCNNGVARLFNMKVEDIIGKDDYDFFEPEQAEFYKNKDRAALEAGTVCINEEWWTFGDNGERALMETRKAPVRSPEGQLLGVLGVARDITARKQMETALQEKHDSLQEAQRIAHIGSWDVDIVNDKLTWSDETFRIWEIDKEKFAATFEAFLNTVHPEDQERVARVYNESIEQRKLYEVEHRLQFPDGRIKHILERGEPYFDADGKPVRFVGTSLEVTERKRMEEELTMKGYALDHSSEALFLVSEQGRFVYVNEQACRSLGYSREELLALGVPDIDPDFAAPSLADRSEKIQKEGGSFVFETHHRRSDGTRFPVEIQMSELNYNGQVLGLALVRDITARKRAESELLDSRNFLDLILNGITDAIAVKDRQHRWVQMNDACCAMIGESREALLGKSDYDFFPKEQADGFREKDELVFTTGEANVNEEILTSTNGEVRYIQTKKTPFKGADGQLLLVAASRDITEIRRAQLALQKREREFRSLAGNIPDNIARWDTEGRYLYVNPTHERLLGSKLGELVGQLIPDSHAHVKAGIDHVVATGQAIHAMRQAVMVEGVEELHDVSLVPEFDETGKVVSVLGMGRDMTERYRLMETLAAREQEFRSLAESAPDNIIRYDREGRTRYLNERLLRQLGSSSLDEVIGKRPSEIWPDGRFSALEEMAARVVASGERSELEVTEPDGKGGLMYHLISVVAERDEQGEIVGTIAFGRNITHLRSTERLMQMIGDHMPGALTHYRLRADLSGELLYASRGLKELYGFTREDLADGLAPMIARIHPDDLPKAVAEQEQAANTLTTAVSEFRVNHPDKGEIWVQQITTPLPESDGSMLWYSLMFDISERKRMEDALAERQAFLDSLFEAIPVPVFYKDRAGRYLGFNRAYETVFGASREQLIGKSVFDTHPRELAETYYAKDAEIFERREVLQQYEYQIKHTDGTLRDVLFSKAAFTNARGEVDGLIGAVLDITERKRMENALRQSEQLTRTVIDATPDWIFIKDQEHRYRLVNQGYADALHLAPGDFIGKTDLDLGFPEELVKGNPEKGIRGFWADDRLVMDSNQTQIFPDDPATIDGVVHTFHTIKVPLQDDGGKPWGVLAFARDISERKQAERQLKETLEFSEGVINAIPDLLFEVDRDGRYLNIWAQNPELLAAQRDLLLGNTINEMLPPDAAAVSMAAIREAGEQGLSLGKVISLALPHGKSWFELSVSRKAGGATSDMHFLVLSRDITERKLAEVALRASEALALQRNELLRAIVESSPEIIVFALDTDYRYLSFNQKHKEVMQAIWGKEIAVGMSMLEVIGDHPDRKAAQRGMDRALAGESFVHEEAYGDEALSRQYWQNYWSPIRSDAGRVVGLTCFVLNITERKKAEEAVRESSEKLRSLFELSPLGIALTDMQGRYVEFNESFRSICGYPADELMTLDYWKLTPRRYEMQEIAQLESLAKTGRYGPYEKEYMQKDGTLIPIQLVGTLITGKDGTQHIWSIVEDIRERKRTEAELKERLDRIVELNDHLERTARDLEDQTVELEAQAVELEASQEQIKQTEVWYRSILHSAPDGMLVVDERGSIMLVNDRLETMFGYERGELQGLAVEVLIPYAARERHVGLRDEFIARDGAYRQAAKTLFGCRKDGMEFPVDVSLSRLPEVEGMRSAICASVRDISERHAMEAAREAALAEMQHLAQLRSTFMAQMSHELRTPLNGILGYAQNLLQGEALGEKQSAGLQIIQNSGEHLLTLINGILDHAAIEADKFELIPGDIELEPFLSTIIGMIRVRAEQKNLAFVCDADAGLPAVVRGDAQRLRQILLNLLSNAVKFTDHGQVTLRVTCPAPSRLRFAVQDSGVGIAADQLETIFIPFEQGGEVSRRAGGTGLGLSISRKLVKLMGGDIRVESQPGAGCTFSFEIDMAAVQSGAEKVNAAALSEQAVTRVVQATAQLLAPPKAELEVLYGSALRGNMREVIKHADRLAEQDSRYLPFAEQLRQLAKGFQTKALLGLIEQYRGETGGGR